MVAALHAIHGDRNNHWYGQPLGCAIDYMGTDFIEKCVSGHYNMEAIRSGRAIRISNKTQLWNAANGGDNFSNANVELDWSSLKYFPTKPTFHVIV